jgi:hypothetical protein
MFGSIRRAGLATQVGAYGLRSAGRLLGEEYRSWCLLSFGIGKDAAMNWYQPCFYSSDSAIEVGIRSLVISHDILFSLVPSIFI